IEGVAGRDGPFHGLPDGPQEPIELPPITSKGHHIADRAHGDLDQTRWVPKRLSLLLRLDDGIENLLGRLLLWLAGEMGRVVRANPSKAEVEQHFLHVGAVGKSIAEAARRSEAIGHDAGALLHGDSGHTNIFENYLLGRLAAHQPGGALKSKLNIL